MMLFLVKGLSCDNIVSGCRTEVKRAPRNREVVGSISLGDGLVSFLPFPHNKMLKCL